MYSASLAPHIGAAPLWQRALAAYGLTDQTYGVAINRYTLQPGMSLPRRSRISSASRCRSACPGMRRPMPGRWRARRSRAGLALDFAVPITFIALVGAGAAQPAASRRGGGLGGGVAGAGLDALQPVAARRRPASRWPTGALVEVWQERRDERGARIWTVILVLGARHLPDPLLVHRAGRRPAAAALGGADAALRAGGGDAGDRRAAGGLAAGHRRRPGPGAAHRRGWRPWPSAPPPAACSAPSPAAWRCSMWRWR